MQTPLALTGLPLKTHSEKIPPQFEQTCRRLGVQPTRFLFVVRIRTQSASLFERGSHFALNSSKLTPSVNARYHLVKNFRCSTSRFGIGETAGSNMTPRGLHRVAEKHGAGWPVGAVFKNRDFTGYTWDGQPNAPITNRIFWLEGLEPGFNRGENIDSYKRYIYIHGTGNEPGIGRPASHGCIHLSADDLIPLHDKLPVGALVWISEN